MRFTVRRENPFTPPFDNACSLTLLCLEVMITGDAMHVALWSHSLAGVLIIPQAIFSCGGVGCGDISSRCTDAMGGRLSGPLGTSLRCAEPAI